MESGLTSVIVPCWNQLDFTRHCLRALFRYTDRPWELIVIDNGSTDGTGEFLAGVQVGGRVPVTVIHNERNRGFPAAINQGLRAARGEFLVMLNNDAVVTEAWLEHLIALSGASLEIADGSVRREEDALYAKYTQSTNGRRGDGGTDLAEDGANKQVERVEGRPTVGLVGPMSNYATPPQLVEGVPYRDLDEMQEFAGRWRAERRGKWFTVGKLSGFCLLMTRAVYEAVGGLDEQFGLGFFDDDDLAERAKRAGFRLAVAHDVFVHHFGSRTFARSGIDAGQVLDENARKFAEKWGQDAPRGRRVALTAWTGPRAGPTERTLVDYKLRIANSGEMGAGSEVSRRGAKSVAGTEGLEGPRGAGESSSSGHRGEKLAGPRARVSLTMIVRDEEKNLPHCLESVRGIFDEIIVVDTGSVDRTVEIAREYRGASVRLRLGR